MNNLIQLITAYNDEVGLLELPEGMSVSDGERLIAGASKIAGVDELTEYDTAEDFYYHLFEVLEDKGIKRVYVTNVIV